MTKLSQHVVPDSKSPVDESFRHQDVPDLKSLRQKAAQLREFHESKIKSKFEENKTYFIVNCETIKTKYGPTFVISTDEGERFFANKKVSKYMEDNHLTISNFKPFGINTYNYKTFVNENGDKIVYLELQIFNSEMKKKSVKPLSWSNTLKSLSQVVQDSEEVKCHK